MDGHIPEELIEKIKGSQDIVEVISRHISLKKSGHNYLGLCPFHSEKTPSFVVSPAKQLYHCFGCGNGGTVITFLMKYDNIPFPEAVRNLAREAGIEIAGEVSGGRKEEEILYEVNKMASNFFHEVLLTSKEGEEARSYLAGRGITEEEIKRFHIGYSNISWDSAYQYLRKKRVKEEILVKSGIVIPRNSGSGCYDRFRGRIMFPIQDLQKRIVGFGGRVLDGSAPKYLNSPETSVFSKGHILYGLDCAKERIRESGCAIIVEGYMDVIAVQQSGIGNAVGTMGTALTINHLKALNRFCKGVVLTFDSDSAGINAAVRTVDTFAGSEVKAKVLLLPEGEDPDTFIRKYGRDAFLDLAEKANPLFDFVLGRITRTVSGLSEKGLIDARVRAAGECLTIIRKIPNRIERDYYLRKVSKDLGVDAEVLYAELRRGHKGKGPSSPAKIKEIDMERPGTEEILLSVIIKDGNLRAIARNNLSKEDFIGHFQDVADAILNSDKDVHEIINSEVCDQGMRNILARMAMKDYYFDSPEKTLSDCIRALQRNRIERELKEIEKELVSAEREGVFDKVRNLLLTKQGLLQKKRLLYENN